MITPRLLRQHKMIRTHTFIKYARLNLQEAEAALQDEDFQKVKTRCQDMAVALLKALVAFIPGSNLDVNNADEKTVRKLVGDLADTPHQADSIVQKIMMILNKKQTPDSRIGAESLYTEAGELFQVVHDLCIT